MDTIIKNIWTYFRSKNSGRPFGSYGTLGWNDIYELDNRLVVRMSESSYAFFDQKGNFLKTVPSSYVVFDEYPVKPKYEFDMKTGEYRMAESKTVQPSLKENYIRFFGNFSQHDGMGRKKGTLKEQPNMSSDKKCL